jgi:putative membrane protein
MNESMTSGEAILLRAEFDARLPKYFLFVSSLSIAATFIGIPFLLFWLMGLGLYIHRRQYESLGCELTPRALNIRRGFLFRTQTNIPLDKITDLAVNEGPVLRYLGLCTLSVETAGGGAGTNMGQASLPGIVNAVGFRDAVLAQRDLITDPGTVERQAAPPSMPEHVVTLLEIRDSLHRIEQLLEKKN